MEIRDIGLIIAFICIIFLFISQNKNNIENFTENSEMYHYY